MGLILTCLSHTQPQLATAIQVVLINLPVNNQGIGYLTDGSVSITVNMKYTLLFLTLVLIKWPGFGQNIDAANVASIHESNMEGIHRIEYLAHRVDTFPDGTVWNNHGYALIEKNQSDPLGISFYARRNDVPAGFIYDSGVGFTINDSARSYEIRKGLGFLGSPGGQMVLREIFALDTVYESRSLTESKDRLILTYHFKDDKTYDVTNIVKNVEFTPGTFIPIKVTRTAVVQGMRTSTHFEVSDIRVNDEVEQSILARKNELTDYELIQKKPTKPNPILGTKLAVASMTNLRRPGETIKIPQDKPVLLDFWENWCGPCVASLPAVERLHQEYSSKIFVLGVIFENKEGALRLINNKSLTFPNSIGQSELKQLFNIDSWPRYFLIDKNGIVRKEYYGFSDQIEKDIQEMIGK